MDIAPDQTLRREFLGQLAAGALVLAGTACAAPIAATRNEPAPATAPPPPHAPEKIVWDDSWASRLTAKNRAVFDSAAISEGAALWHADAYLDGYHEVYQTSDSDVQAVIVMRHAGVPMVLGDALWEKYELGKRYKLKDPATGQPARRNPFVGVQKGDKFAYVASGQTLEALRARGAILLGCNAAAMGMAYQFAEWTKTDPESTKAEVRNGLVPGVTLMPTGIFAVLRAQNLGCAYFKSA